MMQIFVFHYKLRKGLGSDWVQKTEDVALDDLPSELSDYEIKEMARSEFKSRRSQRGTRDSEYVITDIVRA